MKKVFLFSLLILGLSCNDSDNVFEEVFNRGGYVEFVNNFETDPISILDFNEFVFSEDIIDPNNNAILYQLDLLHDGKVVENFITIDTFPSKINFTGTEVLDALNSTVLELNISSSIDFIAKITTPDGVFKGTLSDFNFDTNTQNGGNNGANVFRTPRNNALQFGFSVFLPSPIKLRGTSFEEPFGNDQPYTKRGGEREDEELINNAGERSVQYTAVGNGVNDEIGFRTFVDFDNGNFAGWTSEKIGVSSEDALFPTGFADGSRAYQVADTDGSVIIVFDRVEVDNLVNPITGVQVKYNPAESGYESSDIILITAEVEKANGTSEIVELLNITGPDIDAGLEGQWNTANSGLIQDAVAYTLTIEARTSVDEETIFFDDMILFTLE